MPTYLSKATIQIINYVAVCTLVLKHKTLPEFGYLSTSKAEVRFMMTVERAAEVDSHEDCLFARDQSYVHGANDHRLTQGSSQSFDFTLSRNQIQVDRFTALILSTVPDSAFHKGIRTLKIQPGYFRRLDANNSLDWLSRETPHSH